MQIHSLPMPTLQLTVLLYDGEVCISHCGSKFDWVFLKENTTRKIFGYKEEEVPTQLGGIVQQIHDF